MDLVGVRLSDWTITPGMGLRKYSLYSGEEFLDYLREMLQASPQRVYFISFKNTYPCNSNFCRQSFGQLTKEELERFSIFPENRFGTYNLLAEHYPEIKVLPKDFKEESIPWINPFPESS